MSQASQNVNFILWNSNINDHDINLYFDVVFYYTVYFDLSGCKHFLELHQKLISSSHQKAASEIVPAKSCKLVFVQIFRRLYLISHNDSLSQYHSCSHIVILRKCNPLILRTSLKNHLANIQKITTYICNLIEIFRTLLNR